MSSFSCRNCKKRFVGCHSICSVYQKEKETFEKEKQVVRENSKQQYLLYDKSAYLKGRWG